MVTNTQLRLVRRPSGRVSNADFERTEQPIPALADGQALVRTHYLSIDPTNRLWISDRAQYMEPVALGDVMRGIGLGEVIESKSPRYAVGDQVGGLFGWQEFCVIGKGAVPAQSMPAIPGVPTSALLGACGITGLTAYFGMLHLGSPVEGETVVVSAAAGAVGSIAAQIAKIKGCRVVGIAGGPEKCEHIVDRFGLDAAVDYRSPDFADRLSQMTPNGIDVNFENVGGAIMETIMGRMNVGGRVALCGMIANYNESAPMLGDFSPILMQRLRVSGFIIGDFAPHFAQGIAQLGEWIREDRLRYDETVVAGLEAAPAALNQLFDGANLGKLLVDVHSAEH
jgi:NADPH-dependent curcumin reductase